MVSGPTYIQANEDGGPSSSHFYFYFSECPAEENRNTLEPQYHTTPLLVVTTP